MRRFLVGASIVMAMSIACTSPSMAASIDDTFTFQGRLVISGVPAVGEYDLRFHLYDDSSGGNIVEGPLAINSIMLAADDGGFFTVDLTFPGSPFDAGERLWLDVEYRESAGQGSYTHLGRQELTAVPFATYSSVSGEAAESAVAEEWAGTSVGNASVARNTLGLGALATEGVGTTALTQYVKKSGDSMTGGLAVNGSITASGSFDSTGNINSTSGHIRSLIGGLSAGGYTAANGEVRGDYFRGGTSNFYVRPNAGSAGAIAANFQGRTVSTGTAIANGFATTGYATASGRFRGNYFQGGTSNFYVRPNSGSSSNTAATLHGRLFTTGYVSGDRFVTGTDEDYYIRPNAGGTNPAALLNGRVGLGNTDPGLRLDIRPENSGTWFNFGLRLRTRAEATDQSHWDIGTDDFSVLRFRSSHDTDPRLTMQIDTVTENFHVGIHEGTMWWIGSAPVEPTTIPTGSLIYLDSHEKLRGASGSGTHTTLSSHMDPRAIDPSARYTSFEDDEVRLPWSFTHKNQFLGREESVDMSKLVAWVEKKMQEELGEEQGRLIFARDLPESERLSIEDWETQRLMHLINQRIQQDPWVEVELVNGDEIPAEAWERVEIMEEREVTRLVTSSVLDKETMRVVEKEIEVTETEMIPTGRFENRMRSGYTFSEGMLLRQRTIDDFSVDDFISESELATGSVLDEEGRIVIRELPEWVRTRVPKADELSEAGQSRSTGLSSLSNEELLMTAKLLLSEVRARNLQDPGSHGTEGEHGQ